jgi:hypothetical protein
LNEIDMMHLSNRHNEHRPKVKREVMIDDRARPSRHFHNTFPPFSLYLPAIMLKPTSCCYCKQPPFTLEHANASLLVLPLPSLLLHEDK